jgi:hypothetical protein
MSQERSPVVSLKIFLFLGEASALFIGIIVWVYNTVRAWSGVVVQALRYKSEGPGIDPGGVTGNFFSVESDNSMCPGSTQPLKMSTRILLGVKGRCEWLTTYHLQVPMSRNLEALTSQNPLGPIGL